jgi:large subunit ribosomal protein LP2
MPPFATAPQLCKLSQPTASEMKFVAAYLLASLGADAATEERVDALPAPAPTLPTKNDVRRILSSISAEVEQDRLDRLLALLEVKDIAELIATGREQLAYAPSGAAAGVIAAPTAAEAVEAAKKEEDDDDVALFNLFD